MTSTPAHPPAMTIAPARPPLLVRIGRAIRPSNIAATIPGPIFQKEMWVAGRRGGPYWIRALYAAGLLGLVTLVFTAARANSYGDSEAQRLQQLQQVAPIVTLAILWFQQIALSIAAIILASPAICDEHRAGTLGTLLTTPLKAWQIMMGKLAGLLVQIIVLALLAAPPLLAVRVFGGVEAAIVGKAAAMWISTATLAATLGLYFSVGAKRSPTAAVTALITFAGANFVVPLAIWGWNELIDALNQPEQMPVWLAGLCEAAHVSAWLPPQVPQGWMFAASPPLYMGMLSGEVMGARIPFVADLAVATNSAWNLSVSLLVFMGAAVRLRLVMRREGASGAPAPKPAKKRKAKAGAAEAAEAAAEPVEKSRAVSREVGDSPVLWREARQPFFRTVFQRRLILGAVALFMLWLYWVVGWRDMGDEGFNIPIMVILTLVSSMIAIFSSATLISGERESRTWEVLLTTPASAMDLVLGKFWGAVRKQWFAPGVLLAHLVLMTLFGKVHPLLVIEAAIIMACAVFGVSATGVMFSAMIGKSVRAAAANFGLWLGLWALVPGAVAIVVGFSSGDFPEKVMSALAIPNPVGLMAVAGTGTTGGRRSNGYELYDFGRIGTIEFFMVLAFVSVLYAGACLAALRLAASHISRTTGRRMW